MSKRKVQFEEPAGDGAGGDNASASAKATRFKEKHSLDSDEEDNVEDYEVLPEDDIEGQEDDTGVDIEEGIRFTPFNMKEELEEGHFDSEGMYIQKKEKQIQDSWIENIDWVKVGYHT